jgi:hypothetical protein
VRWGEEGPLRRNLAWPPWAAGARGVARLTRSCGPGRGPGRGGHMPASREAEWPHRWPDATTCATRGATWGPPSQVHGTRHDWACIAPMTIQQSPHNHVMNHPFRTIHAYSRRGLLTPGRPLTGCGPIVRAGWLCGGLCGGPGVFFRLGRVTVEGRVAAGRGGGVCGPRGAAAGRSGPGRWRSSGSRGGPRGRRAPARPRAGPARQAPGRGRGAGAAAGRSRGPTGGRSCGCRRPCVQPTPSDRDRTESRRDQRQQATEGGWS